MERIKNLLERNETIVWTFVIVFFAIMTWVSIQLPQIMN
jgi:hypothetical protein